MRVLVVDDDEIVLDFVAQVLSKAHVVRTVLASDARAIDDCEGAARDHRPAVLVLDYSMPVDPAAVAARVRSLLPDVRVVLFTGTPVDEAARERVGADCVVPKPCAPAALLLAIGGA